MGMGMNDVPSSQKEIIRLKGAVLYPPPPSMYFQIQTKVFSNILYLVVMKSLMRTLFK